MRLSSLNVSIAESDGHRLGLRVVCKRCLPELPANTRLLESTEWDLVVDDVVRIDPNGTCSQGIGDAEGRVDTLRVDSCGKTVGGIVGSFDGVLHSLKLCDGADRAKYLILHNLHVRSDIRKDGWLDKVSLTTVPLAANLNLRAGFLAIVDVSHDTVVLELGDLRPLKGFWIKWVAHFIRLGASLELLNKLVVNAFLDIDAGTGTATLSMIVVYAEVDPSIRRYQLWLTRRIKLG
jgi:hypothetical protein